MNTIIVIVITAIGAGVYLGLCWSIVGIYGLNVSPRTGSGQLTTISRIDEPFGYYDSYRVFHSHFYRAEVAVAGDQQQIVFVRYIPDAFGTPLGRRIGGRPIQWQSRPEHIGILLPGGALHFRRRSWVLENPAMTQQWLGKRPGKRPN